MALDPVGPSAAPPVWEGSVEGSSRSEGGTWVDPPDRRRRPGLLVGILALVFLLVAGIVVLREPAIPLPPETAVDPRGPLFLELPQGSGLTGGHEVTNERVALGGVQVVVADPFADTAAVAGEFRFESIGPGERATLATTVVRVLDVRITTASASTLDGVFAADDVERGRAELRGTSAITVQSADGWSGVAWRYSPSRVVKVTGRRSVDELLSLAADLRSVGLREWLPR